MHYDVSSFVFLVKIIVTGKRTVTFDRLKLTLTL